MRSTHDSDAAQPPEVERAGKKDLTRQLQNALEGTKYRKTGFRGWAQCAWLHHRAGQHRDQAVHTCVLPVPLSPTNSVCCPSRRPPFSSSSRLRFCTSPTIRGAFSTEHNVLGEYTYYLHKDTSCEAAQRHLAAEITQLLRPYCTTRVPILVELLSPGESLFRTRECVAVWHSPIAQERQDARSDL